MPENSFKNFFSFKLLLFLLLLIFIWFGLQLVRLTYKRHELNKEINNLKSEVERLEKSSGDLSQLMNYFNSADFLEREAKEKLNLKKEGENVVVVPEAAIVQRINQESQTDSAKAEDKEEKKEEDGNPVKWWKYFFGK
ncbi:MAG: hypothetical protein UV40_C0010G0008 [Parcubacteria group bacterium GW2011_GWA1_42_7]|nr:MAG: hypothetical protein UV40_C0010G0008 [Parcubacteria group bacterium GW2011_GWA1_42_7]KKS92211.1 MAG: hypothetical protein UV67_C0008G0033 [Parcubacteria group bacterium GW2011_GWC1_43_12]